MNSLPIIRRMPRKQHGFTLIEMMGAFVIFALGFGILLGVLGDALRQTRQSAEYTQAALWAQSLMDAQGIGEPLKEGSSSGQFDDTFSWQLNVSKVQPPQMASAAAAPGNPGNPGGPGNSGGPAPQGVQLQLFQLELVVSWGNVDLAHHANFQSLRVMGPPKIGNQAAPMPGLGG